MKHIDEYYKEWSGEHHTTNSCHPVHDSAEACDFAEFYFKEKSKEIKTIKMKFKDAPIGARFKYPNMKTVWVKIDSYTKGLFSERNGLIVKWNGNIKGHQIFCSFIDEDEGIDFDTVVELI